MDSTRRPMGRYDRLRGELHEIVQHTMDNVLANDYVSVMPRYFERTGFEPATTVTNGRNLYEKLAKRSLDQKLEELQIKERLDALDAAEKRASARKIKVDTMGIDSLSPEEQPVETWALTTDDLLACTLRNPREAYIEELRKRNEAVQSEVAVLKTKVQHRQAKVRHLLDQLTGTDTSDTPDGGK